MHEPMWLVRARSCSGRKNARQQIVLVWLFIMAVAVAQLRHQPA